MKTIKTILFILLAFNSVLMAQVNFTYANLKFKINPSVKYIDGNVTYYFICQAPTDTLTMNFNSSLSIDSIVYHNQTISNFFYTPPDYIHIILPQNSAFIVDSISIIYHGIPNTTGLGSFNQTSHNASPIINTLSQPYGASDWMPSVNNLKDKIDSLKIQIACPIGFKAIANGLLVQSSTTNNESTFIYKHHYPIATYLIALSVTNYVEHTQQFIGTNYSMPIKNYVYPEDDIDWMNGAQHLPNVLRLFDSLFGDYPFKDEQYGMAQINYGGGMEHQTITFMGNYNHEISAHELAHHWFGNKVTCASWHDLWLNEGFATYLSGIAYQYSGTGFYWKPFLSGRMNSTMGEPDGSVYIDDTTSISRMFDGRLTYNKAAMVLHQLRYIIGDSAFFQACRNYLNDASLAFQFATTNDLKLHLESASGLDLDYYFDQWIYGQGYPVYSIALTNNGGNSYNISINYNSSSQVTTTFKLPVPIKFIGVNNDTIIKFFCENQSENFTIQLPFVPTQFICDPNLDIIARSNASVDVVSVQKSSKSVVFPIVSKDIFNISCNEEFTKYELFSLDGQLLSSGYISKGIVNKINIENFPKGLYLLKLISNRQSELFKIIKE